MVDDRLALLWNVLPEARVVGGAIRDFCAGLDGVDVDLASPLTPEAVMARLEAAGVRVLPTGLAHGTVTALVEGRNFEITTLRRDVATDGRHATVAFTDDWAADAARRDFTINAMSMDRDGRIFDYFGGQADLVAGVVRFVGDAATRIEEDYLRILRFFRFFGRYGRGMADADAVGAIAARREGVRRLSVERVWQELKRILVVADPRAALRLMRETGVLAVVLERAVSLDKVEALVARGAPVDPLLRFAALEDDPAGWARLKLSDAESARLATLAAVPRLEDDADDGALRRALANWEAEMLIDRAWLDCAKDGGRADGLRARLAAMARPVFPVRGRDVLELGVLPGPSVGVALAATRRWWLERDCLPDRAECLARLVGLL